MASKLWEKKTRVDKDIERYTIGRDAEMDMFLAPYDVLGSMAHATMLESIGLLSKQDLQEILSGLKNIYTTIQDGNFEIEIVNNCASQSTSNKDRIAIWNLTWTS